MSLESAFVLPRPPSPPLSLLHPTIFGHFPSGHFLARYPNLASSTTLLVVVEVWDSLVQNTTLDEVIFSFEPL